jgi:hypothetical protein
MAGARRIGVFPSYMFDLTEFAARKRQDKLVKTLLKLKEIAEKSGVVAGSQAGENILALQSQIEEEDHKKEEALRAEILAREKAEKEAHEAYLRERDAAMKHEEETKRSHEEREKKFREEMEALNDKDREEKKKRMEEEKFQQEEKRKQDAEQREQKEKERQLKIKQDKEANEKRMADLKAQAAAKKPAASTSTTSSFSATPQKLTGVDAILYWAKNSCEPYGVDVSNFTTCWKDGLAFCALVHAHFPKLINFNECKTKTPNQRMALAFDIAGSQGVPPLLDPEDISEIPTPDRRSMITYLSCLYKCFRR